jgi:hypothetical protein
MPQIMRAFFADACFIQTRPFADKVSSKGIIQKKPTPPQGSEDLSGKNFSPGIFVFGYRTVIWPDSFFRAYAARLLTDC